MQGEWESGKLEQNYPFCSTHRERYIYSVIVKTEPYPRFYQHFLNYSKRPKVIMWLSSHIWEWDFEVWHLIILCWTWNQLLNNNDNGKLVLNELVSNPYFLSLKCPIQSPIMPDLATDFATPNRIVNNSLEKKFFVYILYWLWIEENIYKMKQKSNRGKKIEKEYWCQGLLKLGPLSLNCAIL